MEKRIIARGLLAGAIAGVVAYLFARTFVEPTIGRAVGFEESHIAAHDHGAELFTRSVQANIGMGFGVVAFAVAMGAMFAVTFVVAYGRVGNIRPRALSILLGSGAFGAMILVPALKYPPNPPSIGHADTIRERTGLYLLMVLVSVALAFGGLWLGRKLVSRLGVWSASLAGIGAYVLAVAVVMSVLPGVAETPAGFPADTLYDFRVYSLATQLVMWATISVVFASSAARLLGERPNRQEHSLTA
ncbi:MAG TPA: CbtA family protein [Mycobacterium sp.]|nr:CbtA family protein [Mycobacterium sp.]